MRADSDDVALVHLQRVVVDHLKPVAVNLVQLGERGEAAAVPLDRDDIRPRIEQRAGQSSRAWPDLINPFLG